MCPSRHSGLPIHGIPNHKTSHTWLPMPIFYHSQPMPIFHSYCIVLTHSQVIGGGGGGSAQQHYGTICVCTCQECVGNYSNHHVNVICQCLFLFGFYLLMIMLFGGRGGGGGSIQQLYGTICASYCILVAQHNKISKEFDHAQCIFLDGSIQQHYGIIFCMCSMLFFQVV